MDNATWLCFDTVLFIQSAVGKDVSSDFGLLYFNDSLGPSFLLSFLLWLFDLSLGYQRLKQNTTMPRG